MSGSRAGNSPVTKTSANSTPVEEARQLLITFSQEMEKVSDALKFFEMNFGPKAE